MQNLEYVTGWLSAWAKEQGLVEKASHYCDRWFVNEGGMIGGWTEAELRKVFHSHCLCFKSAMLSYPYAITRINLYAPDGQEVGYYRLITALGGETEDDCLVIECEKPEYLRRVLQKQVA